MSITTEYAQHLVREKMQGNTIKNYLSDVSQFLEWKSMVAPNAFLSEDLADQYIRSSSFTKSPHTSRRKKVALGKFLNWQKGMSHSNEEVKTKIYRPGYAPIAIALILLLVSISIGTSTVTENKYLSEASNVDRIPHSKITIERPIDLSVEGVDVAVSGYEIESPIQDPANMILTLQQNINEQDKAIESLAPKGGAGKIDAGDTQVVIFDEAIGQDSLITVTPTAPTDGKVLYIKSQGEGFAIIALEAEAPTTIPFTWIAIH